MSLTPDYVVGFTDADGSFCVQFRGKYAPIPRYEVTNTHEEIVRLLKDFLDLVMFTQVKSI